MMTMGLNDEVNQDDLKASLEQTLRIQRTRIIIVTRKDEITRQKNQFVEGIMYKPSIVYKICIAPDPDHDNNTAYSYVH